MVLSGTDLRDLNRLTNGIIISNTELASIIHAPCVDVALTGNSESKLLAHFYISDYRSISVYSNIGIRFSSS